MCGIYLVSQHLYATITRAKNNLKRVQLEPKSLQIASDSFKIIINLSILIKKEYKIIHIANIAYPQYLFDVVVESIEIEITKKLTG